MMTVHVLHAGDGYTYLTRQVANGDEVRARGEGLTDYYAASGNPPGRWVGEGCADLEVSGVVDEEHMKALFGEGRHPRANEIMAELIAGGASESEAMAAVMLGRKMPQFSNDTDLFDKWVEAAYSKFERQHGRLPEGGVEADLVKYDVARKWLGQKNPGAAIDDTQIRKFFAERGAKTRQPVAGYDLVFTPPKSVSVLWGLADRDTARQIEAAHESAWRQSLAWLEKETALTRRGAGGITQINAVGFVGTAVDHIDSRAGDPNLHTHVAIANRVQGVDGQWRALDARGIHHFAVAASERYNLLIEHEVSRRLGVHFEDAYTRRGGQPVREISGVDKPLRDVFSQRAKAIEMGLDDLVESYKAKHGVMPSKATQIRLAQEATLATRQGKEAGMTLLERRQQWAIRAAEALGSAAAITSVVTGLQRTPTTAAPVIDHTTIDELSATVVATLTQSRARWNRAHVAAEAARTVRAAYSADGALGRIDDPATVIQAVTERAYNGHSISLEAPEALVRPALLSRQDGESLFRTHGAQWRTSMAVLDREDALLAAARTLSGPVIDPRNVDLVNSLSVRALDPGQIDVARQFVSSGKLLDAAIGAAGTGKTTAMRAFARAAEMGGARVVGLAPSAVAAKVLGNELELHADTVAKFLVTQRVLLEQDAQHRAHLEQRRARGEVIDASEWAPRAHPLRLDASTIVLIDEAGMTDASDIAQIVETARAAGARVCLLGDPAQLDAVTGAGALRMLDREIGVGHLTKIHRFVNADETAATELLRAGDIAAAEFYINEGRLVGGTHAELLDRMYTSWRDDRSEGLDSVMIAHSNQDVATLAARAQADRVAAGEVQLTDIQLHNGHQVGVGDHVVTRRNDRNNGTAGDFVKNGDRWRVDAVDAQSRLHLTHLETGVRTTLDCQYAAEHVDLAYATTIHLVQGRTVDRCYMLTANGMTRELLYVGLTRGRERNMMFVPTDAVVDVDGHSPVPDGDSPAAVLRRIIANEGAELSARETFQREIDVHESLSTMLEQYEAVQRDYAPPLDHEHARDVVMRAFGGAGNYVTDDTAAWPRVARLVDDLERSGVDPIVKLGHSARIDELATDGSPGLLLLERAGEIGPGRRTGIDEIDTWLEGTEQRIADRLGTDHLVDPPHGRHLDAIRRAWTVKPPVPSDDVPGATVPVTPALAPNAAMPVEPVDRATALRQRIDQLTAGQETRSVPQEGPGGSQGISERISRLRPGAGALTAAQRAAELARELERKDGPEIGS